MKCWKAAVRTWMRKDKNIQYVKNDKINLRKIWNHAK